MYAFNSHAQLQWLELGQSRSRVLLIDDALTDLSQIRQDAVGAAFREDKGSYYPGVRAELPQAYARSLLEALYPLPFVETIEPLTYHTYDGLEPPLLGNPVNTSSPFAHVDVALAESDTEGVTALETVSVTLLLVTFATVGQAALVVNTQVIISPFTQELAVYVAELVPTFPPFFFH